MYNYATVNIVRHVFTTCMIEHKNRYNWVILLNILLSTFHFLLTLYFVHYYEKVLP